MRTLQKVYLLLLLNCICFNCGSQNLSYPYTRSTDDSDIIFGTTVKDPYRWLEKDKSQSVINWASKQDSIATDYLNSLKVRFDIRAALRTYGFYSNDCPTLDGDYYFRLMKPDEFETSSLYIRTSLHTGYDMLIDTRYFDEVDRISIKDWRVSHDSRYLAFAYGRNGSEETEAGIVKLPGGGKLAERLSDIGSTNFAWKDSGFYYCRYSPDTSLHGKQIVCYHSLNTSQQLDKIIFEKGGIAKNAYSVQTTSDERYLIIYEYNTELLTHTVYYKDLNDPAGFIKPLIARTQQPLYVLDHRDSDLICLTEYPNYPNRSIVAINPDEPLHFKSIVPHMPDLKIDEAIVLKDKILLLLQDTFIQRLAFFSFEGKLLHAIAMPFGVSCSNLNGSKGNNFVLYNQESYCFPGSLYMIDTKTYDHHVYSRSEIAFEYEDFEVAQRLVKSKDGTEIPVLMLYDKYHKPSPNSPALLEAYGGFNISPSQKYDPQVVFFVKHGGVYINANIRGGGFLSNWHQAGSGLNKQKSYDDVIAVAEYLIAGGFTSPAKLALKGGSNGGLMVGAVITQRPDLFKAAIAEAGLFDMVRYENYYFGKAWKQEYGSVSDSADFKNLLSYSPYHHVRQNITYPATLIYTSENDDRVSPSHSYKFAAQLQSISANTNPVILKLIRQSGHTGTLIWNDYEEIASEELAFLFHHLKMKW